MKYYLKKFLFITFFLAVFHVSSMPNLVHKVTKLIQTHPLIHGYKERSRGGQFLAGIVLGYFLKKEFCVNDTEWQHSREVLPICYGLCTGFLVSKSYIINKALNADKNISNIRNTVLSKKKGLRACLKKFNLRTHNYSQEFETSLESIIFSNKYLLKEQLPIESTVKLLRLITSAKFERYGFNHIYNNNKKLKDFLLQNEKLIDTVKVEIFPIIKTIEQMSVIKEILWEIIIYTIFFLSSIKNPNYSSELRMLALLIMLYSIIEDYNLYFEVFFTSLFLVSVAKAGENSLSESELKSYFKKLDKSIWHNDLCNPHGIKKNLDRITNIYFLTKIKEAINDNKNKVIEKDCLDFQNFIRACISSHLFCSKTCSGKSTGRDICKIIRSYTFLNSIFNTFGWMITAFEQNPFLYEIKETENKKQIKYKEMTGEFEENELHILPEILNLKDEIKNFNAHQKETAINNFVIQKITEQTEEKRRELCEQTEILQEELRYILIENYHPKNHPDFKKEINIRDFLVKKSFTHLKKPFLKVCYWTLILHFPNFLKR